MKTKFSIIAVMLLLIGTAFTATPENELERKKKARNKIVFESLTLEEQASILKGGVVKISSFQLQKRLTAKKVIEFNKLVDFVSKMEEATICCGPWSPVDETSGMCVRACCGPAGCSWQVAECCALPPDEPCD